jgi:bifunctional non-homologous end joining protein LigD
MPAEPFTLQWTLPPIERRADAWHAEIDGRPVRLTNLDKNFWPAEGYTKGDVIAYYLTVADAVLPYVVDRPLTMKRMPNGIAGEFFYAKQAPPHTPPWIRTAPVVARRTGDRIDYVVATDRASLAWLANLGCIELHPWHSRVQSLGAPDYAFFDLDPFGVEFPVVRDVALHVRAILEQLGLQGYPRTSGATGMQVYVPLDPVHDYGDVRAWVERCCVLINRADPGRTTMEWDISRRDGRVFLDHNMNVEGKNIAATWCLRPEPHAPVATPLRWEEVGQDVWPQDFTIATVHRQMAERAALFAPVLQGGQDLRQASAALGLPPLGPIEPHHRIVDDEPDDAGTPAREDPGDLARYTAIRDFERTPEPGATATAADGDEGPRFVIQHHLATRLHHDLRLERGGTLRSWAVPKGLPLVRGERHLAVQTEDHPL